MPPRFLKHVLVLLSGFALLNGCASSYTVEHERIAFFSQWHKPQAGHSPAQVAELKSLCAFGEPQHTPGWAHGPTIEIFHTGYLLEESSTDKIPLWVCEHLGNENLGGDLKRPKTDPFAPDPLLPASSRSELSDYKGSGYDRGHQAPSGDETKDPVRQRETFYLSNMVPQVGQFNQHSWAGLEDMVRKWATARGEAFVITGPMFYDPKEDDTSTATGHFTYKTVGKDQVAVPTHLYKIVFLKDGNGTWHAIAFVMPNQTYPPSVDYKIYIQSIHWIEDHTGLNFMPDLDSNPNLHQQLESSTPSAVWPNSGPN